MGEFIPLFPTILAVTELGLTASEKKNITKYILQNCNQFKKKSKDGVIFEESPSKLHRVPIMEPLIQKLIPAVREAIKGYGVNPEYIKFHITRSWANLNTRSSVTSAHTHINSHLSIVYYPDMSCNQATINFLEPSPAHNWIPGIMDPSYIKIGVFKQTKASATTLCFEPKEDTCLIFPSSLAHSVSENPSEQPRLSIAMDTLFTLRRYQRDEPLLPPPSDWREFAF